MSDPYLDHTDAGLGRCEPCDRCVERITADLRAQVAEWATLPAQVLALRDQLRAAEGRAEAAEVAMQSMSEHLARVLNMRSSTCDPASCSHARAAEAEKRRADEYAEALADFTEQLTAQIAAERAKNERLTAMLADVLFCRPALTQARFDEILAAANGSIHDEGMKTGPLGGDDGKK